MRGKVFGIGLSKTGTTSLTTALRRLGYNAVHYPVQPVFKAAEMFDAITDLPAAAHYDPLGMVYPLAKFILTIRDIDSWLESCSRHFVSESRNPTFQDYRRVVYGVDKFDERFFRKAYTKHSNNVIRWAYRTGRTNKEVLIFNLCGGEGYETLCPFLGLPVIDERFPHENKD